MTTYGYYNHFPFQSPTYFTSCVCMYDSSQTSEQLSNDRCLKTKREENPYKQQNSMNFTYIQASITHIGSSNPKCLKMNGYNLREKVLHGEKKGVKTWYLKEGITIATSNVPKNQSIATIYRICSLKLMLICDCSQHQKDHAGNSHFFHASTVASLCNPANLSQII